MKKRNVFRYSCLFAVFVVLFIAWIIFYVEPFLSRSSPVNTDILIVEEWVDQRYMPMAAEVFRKGTYRHIFIVGVPRIFGPQGGHVDNAGKISHTLIELGIDASLVTEVPTPTKTWHKTWSQASAFRNYLVRSGYQIKAVNVFTVGVHARKSHLLYQRALGPEIQVGVISVRHYKRSSSPWWLSFESVFAVAKNAISYLDALLLTGWGDNGITDTKIQIPKYFSQTSIKYSNPHRQSLEKPELGQVYYRKQRQLAA